MPNRLEMPDDLNHLIEKREGEDRRAAEAAAGEAQAAAKVAEEEANPAPQPRSNTDRRQA